MTGFAKHAPAANLPGFIRKAASAGPGTIKTSPCVVACRCQRPARHEDSSPSAAGGPCVSGHVPSRPRDRSPGLVFHQAACKRRGIRHWPRTNRHRDASLRRRRSAGARCIAPWIDPGFVNDCSNDYSKSEYSSSWRLSPMTRSKSSPKVASTGSATGRTCLTT